MSKSDESLVARYQKGDAAAFGELYARHRIGTLNLLLFMVRDRAAAEDIHQEIWLTVTHAALEWKPTGSFKSWLFQIARNRALDHLRKVMRSPKFEENEDLDVIEEPGKSVPQYDPIVRAALLGCIETLNDTQRQVFMMRVTSELTFAEITEVMASAPGLANRRMQLAVQHVKRCLEGKGIRADS